MSAPALLSRRLTARRLLKGVVGAIGAIGISHAVSPRAAEAVYTAGTTEDTVDRDLRVQGGLNVDQGTMVVNAATDRVGLSDANPAEKLTIRDNADVQLRLYDDGNRAGFKLGNNVFIQAHTWAANAWRRLLVAHGVKYNGQNQYYDLTNQWERGGFEFVNGGAFTV